MRRLAKSWLAATRQPARQDTQGLRSAGFGEAETGLVLGDAWHRFLKANLPVIGD